MSAARAELESRREQVAAAEAHLETLQATQVVWRGDANEVQLAGSFDGWTSKVRQEGVGWKTGATQTRARCRGCSPWRGRQLVCARVLSMTRGA